MDVVKVESFQELLESFILLLQFYEELLRMAARLGARSSAHVLLHVLPLLAEQLKRLKEAEMLIAGPTARFSGPFFLQDLCRLVTIEF